MSKPPVKALTILVVDDSCAFRDRVRRYLSDDPSVELVGEAEDGLAALREIDRLRPDVVLLDLHMPGIDGFRVLPEVKARYERTTVIVLTADASEIVRRRCAALHADAVIDKGDAAASLRPALHQLLAESRM